ncbi:3-oxoacyl-ACP reductase, putative [Trypanosoma equiperdum]|uniref:3-oxoacyl-(Acyl-carrier protein) reductase, putative n=4 Tax=Trypanozoon TaxID=39700 RepID=Q585V0_TRYB2|nr:3-oxoacyl-(acyl-carrier protein) reductase,putative [Trypanosoma brucei gambiense DAL972]XP_951693.1 3-oxoacyl-(acyl-carrier protein) reductase, putative [Trypanosoma brucei brucei TREU927]AAX79999.1 3-oxoacyl-(acyl-carrier protein) reductase, putative [Trypanosoma brucei]RHW74028.1 3-oxoacyl-ACP reductase [Trypanosoma brucei equiperdum]SCU71403.1 3-oxoacyl-ACP reductase, putative [Trypanosoma equiperdum]AAQ15979.1 3-oxoacyl-(acyl-carrier protein) reductase, putative [Trypanosoma brucei bru|eukprot:XP_011771882.1 3-oxoacyl-(acyl-carrier protein) reductase,putative [Trypanosoma brucei gambiense DAL972]
MPWNLQGRVAVVVGASSTVGRQVASRLADEHRMRLACVSRRGCGSSLPSGCVAFKADLTVAPESDTVMKQVKETLGPVSLLVNCAGVTLNKIHVRCTDTDYDVLMNVNLRGALHITRSALRHGGMLQVGDGSVVHIGSLVGCMGNEGQVIYSASKAALSGAVKSWAREYGPKNIRFNVIAPALIEGEGMATTLTENQIEEWRQRCPLRRLATVTDVVDAVVGVACCPFISGQTIHVDGGMW